MLYRLVFGLLILVVVVNSARAEDPLKPGPGDENAIRECLQNAHRKKEKDFEECIGVVSGPCMEKPGGYSTVGMMKCNRRETNAWDSLLNEYYQNLQDRLEEEVSTELRDIQRVWIKWRDAKCHLVYTLHKPGTITGPLMTNCHKSMTAKRALELRSLLERYTSTRDAPN